MSVLTKDRAFALAVILLVAIMFVESADIPPASRWQPYGSAFFPRLLLGVVGILSVLLLIRSFLPAAAAQRPLLPDMYGFIRANPRVIALFGVFVLYVALMPVVGYLAATMGFLALSFVLLSGFASRGTAITSVALVILIPIAVFVVFENVLSIRLP